MTTIQELRGVDQPPRPDLRPSQGSLAGRGTPPSGLHADPPRSTSEAGGSSTTSIPPDRSPGLRSITAYCEICAAPTRDGSYRCDQHVEPKCRACGELADIIEFGIPLCLDPSCSGRRG